jgi:hypothetical protein
MWSVFSITILAREIGFEMSLTPATAPKFRVPTDEDAGIHTCRKMFLPGGQVAFYGYRHTSKKYFSSQALIFAKTCPLGPRPCRIIEGHAS